MQIEGKYKKLFAGLLLDGIGMLSLAIPGLGEFLDILWAPVAGWFMTRLYPGRKGKIAGVVAFLEELLPGLDLIPSFTLMWLYTYVLSKKERVGKVAS
ncbi:hypothetical protein [Robiginitalea sp.]|jgi:hypothetical protein|uniref:hypothetical protein n=1 Tax=Robiginitalea sp. TaxID=1902411 RepID=UPI003C754F2F